MFKRRAAGTARRLQLIAANVDTLFVVSSCNQDFNIARLERYLALAKSAEVTPVVVLTKADLVPDASEFVAAIRELAGDLVAECVDARHMSSLQNLLPWCGNGQTVALLGSSGVGKSTLINTLTGQTKLDTQETREADAKGRHTTTARSMYRLSTGGWLIDTPGMRELQLTDVDSGVDGVFEDVLALAEACRFANCQHETEPSCAVREAIAGGRLDTARLRRYRKLSAENKFNSESLAERRARFRAFGKRVRSVVREKRRRRGEM